MHRLGPGIPLVKKPGILRPEKTFSTGSDLGKEGGCGKRNDANGSDPFGRHVKGRPSSRSSRAADVANTDGGLATKEPPADFESWPPFHQRNWHRAQKRKLKQQERLRIEGAMQESLEETLDLTDHHLSTRPPKACTNLDTYIE